MSESADCVGRKQECFAIYSRIQKSDQSPPAMFLTHYGVKVLESAYLLRFDRSTYSST